MYLVFKYLFFFLVDYVSTKKRNPYVECKHCDKYSTFFCGFSIMSLH